MQGNLLGEIKIDTEMYTQNVTRHQEQYLESRCCICLSPSLNKIHRISIVKRYMLREKIFKDSDSSASLVRNHR